MLALILALLPSLVASQTTGVGVLNVTLPASSFSSSGFYLTNSSFITTLNTVIQTAVTSQCPGCASAVITIMNSAGATLYDLGSIPNTFAKQVGFPGVLSVIYGVQGTPASFVYSTTSAAPSDAFVAQLKATFTLFYQNAGVATVSIATIPLPTQPLGDQMACGPGCVVASVTGTLGVVSVIALAFWHSSARKAERVTRLAEKAAAIV